MESAPTLPAGSDKPSGDKAGEIFWDRMWQNASLPPPMDPHRGGLKNYPPRKFHGFFQKVWKDYPTQGRRLLEIGCAQSVFLPYFANYFGFEVAGLDRSGIGCEKARLILEREHVKGEVYCADFFSPPEQLFGKFDVVISFGVVEHFENTVEPLRALAKLLKPEGRMITSIPNLAGMLGGLQKVLDRSIYDVHVPLDKEGLAAAHQEAGLEVLRCAYFLPISLEVLNVDRWPKGAAYKITIRFFGLISRTVWLLTECLPLLRPNRWTSPYINCVARKA